MSFSFPAFSYLGTRLPMGALPVAPPIAMPTFDDDQLDEVGADTDIGEIDGEDEPDESGDGSSSD